MERGVTKTTNRSPLHAPSWQGRVDTGLWSGVHSSVAMLSSSPVLKFVDEKGFDEKSPVTDVAYDYHGRRLATVSADAVIRIRDLDDNGAWCVEDGCEIKSAHQVRILLSRLAKRCGSKTMKQNY